jgi:hypothetical protein
MYTTFDAAAGDIPSEPELACLRDQLAPTPASTIITNHCLGIWELAAMHLSLDPPQLSEAAVARDALGGIVDALQGRLGDEEDTLHVALAQLWMAFVTVEAARNG